MSGRVLRWLVAASWLLLGACVTPPAREPVDSFAAIGSGETVVVGRVELVPPLRKGEQKVGGFNTSQVENKVYLIADEERRVLTKEPGVKDYTGRIDAILGKNFFVRSKSRPFYILGGMMYLDLTGREVNQAYFPGGLMAALKPGDKAVYVGTVRYYRNEFFEVTKVTVADDYENANAEFKKKFGAKHTLRKALLIPAK